MARGVARDGPAIKALGDTAVKAAFKFTISGAPDWERDLSLSDLQRRLTVVRAWSLYFDEQLALRIPDSRERQFPINDNTQSPGRVAQILAAQATMTTTMALGLPGLSVPTGVVDGLPAGVQICATRFREDVCFAALEIIARAAAFTSLDHLAAQR